MQLFAHTAQFEQEVSSPVQLSPAMRCHALILLLPGTLAFQFPFKVPFFNKQTIRADVVRELPVAGTPRIAIIGAGAGGSSAAFWISKAKERFGLDIEVDVYEREAYIGGRTSKILTSTPHSITLMVCIGSTVVYPYENSSLPPLELGASIFVEANKNLWRASDEFNLTRDPFEQGGETGVWDGEKLILSVSLNMLPWTQDATCHFRLAMDGGTPSRCYGVTEYTLRNEHSPCKRYFG